jgi:hypothetical protein
MFIARAVRGRRNVDETQRKLVHPPFFELYAAGNRQGQQPVLDLIVSLYRISVIGHYLSDPTLELKALRMAIFSG